MVWHTCEGVSSIDQWIWDKGMGNLCLEAPGCPLCCTNCGESFADFGNRAMGEYEIPVY